MDDIAYILGFATVLLLWLDTNAVYEYARLFGLGDYGWFREYKAIDVEEYTNFTTWLATAKRHFFIVRLTTCPICLATWLCALSALVEENFWQLLILVPTLCVYGLVRKLLT